MPLLRQDPTKLVQHHLWISHVLDRLEGHDEIELAVLEGQPSYVSTNEVRGGVAGTRVGNRCVVEVDAHHRRRACLGQQIGSVALTARGIEDPTRAGKLRRNAIAGQMLGVHDVAVLGIGHKALARCGDGLALVLWIHGPTSSIH